MGPADYVGFIFGGVKANPLWATTLMPVIFLLSACVSGIAGIILVYVLIMKLKGRPVDMDCIRTSLKILWGFFILDFVFEMLEVFSQSNDNLRPLVETISCQNQTMKLRFACAIYPLLLSAILLLGSCASSTQPDSVGKYPRKPVGDPERKSGPAMLFYEAAEEDADPNKVIVIPPDSIKPGVSQ